MAKSTSISKIKVLFGRIWHEDVRDMVGKTVSDLVAELDAFETWCVEDAKLLTWAEVEAAEVA